MSEITLMIAFTIWLSCIAICVVGALYVLIRKLYVEYMIDSLEDEYINFFLAKIYVDDNGDTASRFIQMMQTYIPDYRDVIFKNVWRKRSFLKSDYRADFDETVEYLRKAGGTDV